jgi:hypothetical protein
LANEGVRSRRAPTWAIRWPTPGRPKVSTITARAHSIPGYGLCNDHPARLSMLRKFAQAVGVPVAELFTEEKKKGRTK